jgi:uncharacterized small protein (DUF1192 family)
MKMTEFRPFDRDAQDTYIANLREKVTPYIVGKNVVNIRVSGARHILSRIDALETEIERLRAENKRLSKENVDWHSCVITDILMSGPVFTGGSRSALLRCFERYIRGAAPSDQTGGEG